MQPANTTPHPASAAAQPGESSGAAAAPRVPAESEAVAPPREHRKALPVGSLDCSKDTAEQIEALIEMPYKARWQITTLNFSGNKAFTDAHLIKVLNRFSKLQTLYIDGTAVSNDTQASVIKYHTAKDAMLTLDLPVKEPFFIGCNRDNLPCFNLQSLDAAELQAFIAALKYPANAAHVATIESITFAGNKALTDELFEQIIALLPNIRIITANCTNITQLPASLNTREYLTEVDCHECPHITDQTKPAGLRPEIQVSMQIMISPARRQRQQALQDLR